MSVSWKECFGFLRVNLYYFSLPIYSGANLSASLIGTLQHGTKEKYKDIATYTRSLHAYTIWQRITKHYCRFRKCNHLLWNIFSSLKSNNCQILFLFLVLILRSVCSLIFSYFKADLFLSTSISESSTLALSGSTAAWFKALPWLTLQVRIPAQPHPTQLTYEHGYIPLW